MISMEVVGCGALNVDKIFKVPRIAKEDEESFVISSEGDSAGGSAANTIVALARLGVKTGYIGKLGNDEEGKFYLRGLEKEGVDTRGIIIAKEGNTGEVIVFVDDNGERSMYINPGVNDELDENKALWSLSGMGPEFLHLSSFVGETSWETQKLLVNEAGETKISFDPGDLYVRKGLAALRPLLEKSAVVFLNEREVRILSQEEDYSKGAEALLKTGAKMIVVKRGKDGCYIAAGKERITVKTYQVKAVDTTGAGDAFNAGFLYGLLRNKSLKACGKTGNFVAARCITTYGARDGLPTAEEVAKEGPE